MSDIEYYYYIEGVKIATPIIGLSLTAMIGLLTVRISKQQKEISKQQAETNRQQAEISKHKIRLDLFEKRIQIFDATRIFLSVIVYEPEKISFDGAMLNDFTYATMRADFLYPKELCKFLMEVRDKGISLEWHHGQKGREVHMSADESKARVEEIVLWAKAENEKLQQRFHPYIGFDNVW